MKRFLLFLCFTGLAFGQFTNATKLRGKPLCNPSAPADGNPLAWNAAQGCWGTGGNLTVGTTVLDPNGKLRTPAIGALDVSQAVAPNAATALSTPVPYTGTELVHPDVVIFPNGWNGYRYWMAITPYQNTDNAKENPSIYASQDGWTWVTPAGLTNPVIPAWGGGTYNSDPDLVAGMDGKLYLFDNVDWQTGAAGQIFYVTSSSDGVNWSPLQVAFTGPALATEREASPAFLTDGKTWTMYYIDIVSYTVRRRTAPSPTGPWSVATVITLANPASKQPWHVDAMDTGGRIILLIDFVNVSDGGNGQLYFAWADDPAASTFTVAPQPVLSYSVGSANEKWDARNIYRATFALLNSGAETRIAIWYSVHGPTNLWKLGYTEAVLRPPFTAPFLSACYAGLGFGVGCDAFNRADSNSSLGISTSGQTWTVDTGTAGISSGKAYLPSATNTRAWVDSGTANHHVLLHVSVPGGANGQEYLMFRFVDGANFWRLGHYNDTLLQKVVAGSVTTLCTVTGYVTDDWLEVVTSGNTITVYDNGAPLCTVSDAFNSSATKVGFQSANTTVRFSHFAVLSR